jgi:hypothetical protein
MGEERTPKRGLNGNFHTTRPVGRQKWAAVVQRDALQLLGIRGWRSKAANRDEWRSLMREAKAWKGLQRHVWMDVIIVPVGPYDWPLYRCVGDCW